MSGGGGTNTVTNSGPPQWAVPYYQGALERAGQVASLPYQPYTGTRTAGLNPVQTAGLNATATRAIQGAPEVGQARQQLGDTLGGAYLGYQAPRNPFFGENPFLQSQIDRAQGDVVRNYRDTIMPQLASAERASGSFGNAGLAQMRLASEGDLMKRLGDISSGLRFQDYTTQQGLGEAAVNRNFQGFQSERDRMMQGTSLAPTLAAQDYIDTSALTGVGDVFNRQTQAGLDQDYANFLEARGYPREQLGVLQGALGINSGQQSSTQGPGVNRAAAGLGGAAAGASLAGMLPAAYAINPMLGAAIGGGLGLMGGK